MDRKKEIGAILGVRDSGQTKKNRGSISILGFGTNKEKSGQHINFDQTPYLDLFSCY
jgi:hypothetical protein